MEIFKRIPNFDNYIVSNYGRVIHLSNKRNKKVELKPIINEYGYARVHLIDERGNRKWFPIHRLVANAFIKNIDNKTQVNHKNGNKLDNNYKNLEWCSPKENIEHAYKKGLNKTKKVIQYEDAIPFAMYRNCHQASIKSGISYASIYNCLQGKNKSAGGYTWKWAK